jgi:hypothetical protein
MATYCECGDVATRFYDEEGRELFEPCCEECWIFSLLVQDVYGYPMAEDEETQRRDFEREVYAQCDKEDRGED